MFGTHVVLLKLMGVVLWFVASSLGAELAVAAGWPCARRSPSFSLLWLVPGALMIISTRAYLGYAGGLWSSCWPPCSPSSSSPRTA